MNRQVVLEIGNTQIRVGSIEASSLPIKRYSAFADLKTGEFNLNKTVCSASFDQNSQRRAIKANEIIDFDFLITLIEDSLLNTLQIPKESFEQIQLTLVLPSNLVSIQLPLRTKLIKAVYERLGVGAVFVAEVASAATLGSAHGTALVLNFDYEGVEIAAVNDFCVIPAAIEYFSYPLGSIDVFSGLIAGNSEEDGTVQTSSGESVQIEQLQRQFYAAFVNMRNERGLNFIDSIESVLERIDPDRRAITLNHIILNGNFPIPSYPAMCSCITSSLSNSALLAVSDYPADSQPSAFTFRSIPEYYNEIKESGRDAVAFFGATLAGKYAHADPKTFIIKDKE